MFVGLRQRHRALRPQIVLLLNPAEIVLQLVIVGRGTQSIDLAAFGHRSQLRLAFFIQLWPLCPIVILEAIRHLTITQPV